MHVCRKCAEAVDVTVRCATCPATLCEGCAVVRIFNAHGAMRATSIAGAGDRSHVLAVTRHVADKERWNCS
jgi:hypothetical protein